MFERYGIRDVFVGLWKFKVWIVLLGIIGIISALGITNIKSRNNNPQTMYRATQQYRFEPVRNTEDREVLNSIEYSSGQVATTYMALFDTTACKQFITQQLTMYGENISESQLGGYVTYSLLKDNTILAINVSVPDEKLVMPLLEAYGAYIENEQNVLYGNQSDNIKEAGITTTEKSEISIEVNYKKIGLTGGLIGILAGCIFVFFITLFRPTINRKTDLEEFNVDLLGEIDI